MWGLTLFDQLWCRIAFKKLRYEGEFTPPSRIPSLQWPGIYGGMNWGSAAIDERHGYLIVNDMRIAQSVQMFDRFDYVRLAASQGKASLERSGDTMNAGEGTPFGARTLNFFSPLGIPCQEPPYGTMTAIDLRSHKIVWQKPLGTVQDTGPLKIKTRLPIPLGMPSLGGSVVTGGGLTFYSGTQDYFLRAFETATGKEVWKYRLPVGSQATPMSYVSSRTGRQFVIASAGGARLSPDRGDYILAFAIPRP